MSGQPRPSRWASELRRAVEAAGGSVTRSRDGHLKVYDATGVFVAKTRAAGKRGNETGAAARGFLASVVRTIEERGRS